MLILALFTEPPLLVQVAEFASWTVFVWLFALLAYDGLSGVPDVAWGTPLVLLSICLVVYTAYMCYRDVPDLEDNIEQEVERAAEQTTAATAPTADEAPDKASAASKVNDTSSETARAGVRDDEAATATDIETEVEPGAALDRHPSMLAVFCAAEPTASDAHQDERMTGQPLLI